MNRIIKHKELYLAILKYRKIPYTQRTRADYNRLVDLSIKAGLIPECNRYEPSTHGRLKAAITYDDNLIRYCNADR